MKLMVIGLFSLFVVNNLAAQASFSATLNTKGTYQIDKQATISSYQWTVYNDANLTSQTSSADAVLTTLGAGRENEIQVTWNKLGTFYLAIVATDLDGCDNRMAYEFEVVANNLPVLADDVNSTTETLPIVQLIGVGSILDNDSEPDGESISVASINGDNTGSVNGTYGALIWKADGSYTYTPNAEMDSLSGGEPVYDIFNVRVEDELGGGSISKLTITINGSNTAPIADNDNLGTLFVHEGSAGVSGDMLSNDTDADGDVLSVGSINGITDALEDVKGLYGVLDWSLNGDFTYTPNAALDTLSAGEVLIETFTYTVSDGNGGTDTAIITIEVRGENDNPEPLANKVSTVETDIVTESSVTGNGNLLANDTDPESDVLRVDSIGGTNGDIVSGIYGELTWYSNGSYTYVPNSKLDSLTEVESVQDIFTYYVSDGNGGQNSTTLTVSIEGENDRPVLYDDFNSTIKIASITEEDGSGNLLVNDIDVDGDVLRITSINDEVNDTIYGTYGMLVWKPEGSYTYTPNAGLDSLGAGESVVESFTYRADDPYGGFDTAALTITINGDNDAPVLVNDTNRTNDESPVTEKGDHSSGNLLANDTDANGDVLRISSIDGVSDQTVDVVGIYGTLDWGTGGIYTYTPNAGVDSLDAGEIVTEVFTYYAEDGKGGSGSATITITITGTNEAPVLVDNTNSTTETLAVTQSSGDGNLLDNDSDSNGNSLSVSFIGGLPTSTGTIDGSYGTLIWDATGSYTYTPNAELDSLYKDELVEDVFVYRAEDGLGGSSTAKLTIQIRGLNELPVFVDDFNATIETNSVADGGSNSSGNLLVNDSDIDGDALSIASINGEGNDLNDVTGVYGKLNWNSDGTYIYSPNIQMDSLAVGESVIETFSVTVSDGNGGEVVSTLRITINGENGLPLAINDSNSTTETNVIDASGSSSIANLLVNDTDADGDVLSIASINGFSNPSNDIVGIYGSLNWNADGSYVYTPNSELDSLSLGENVVETFTQIISDGNGGTSTTTLAITIRGSNQGPVLANDVNSTILNTDIDHSDGSGRLLSNDYDKDGDILSVISINGTLTTTGSIVGTYGTLSWTIDGSYSYDVNSQLDTLLVGERVQDVFTYTAGDGTINETAELTITISGSNVAPVLADDSNSTIGTDIIHTFIDGVGNVTDNDSDANGDALLVTHIDGISTGTGILSGTYGSLSWSENGEYIYTPNSDLDSLRLGENVSESFIVRISDGNGEAGNSNLIITINGENDLPVLADDSNSTIETVVISKDANNGLLNNDSDSEDTVLRVASINGISNSSSDVTGTYGLLNWEPDGSYSYTPNSSMDSLSVGENVVETFTVQVMDSDGGSSISTFTITIYGANDAPLAVADSNETIEVSSVSEASASGSLLGNDIDVDGDALVVSSINGVSNVLDDVAGTYGRLNWNSDGTYTYTPNAAMDSLSAGEIVIENFTYTISDGNGGTATAILSIDLKGVNQAPVLADDSNVTIETAVLEHDGPNSSGGLLANDNDSDGNNLEIVSIDGVSSPLTDIVGTYGTLNWNSDGSYTYTPNAAMDSLAAGENVSETFTYIATDGTETKSAVLSLVIRGANTDPVLLADTNATVKTDQVDEGGVNSSGNILSNDIDPDGDALEIDSIGGEVTGTTIGIYGKLIWNPDGTYTFFPNEEMDSLSKGEIVYEIFDYVAIDNKGGYTHSTLTIAISGENNGPVLASDINSTTKTNVVTVSDAIFGLLSNDIDPDGDALSVTTIGGVSTTTGTISGNYGDLRWNADGTYTYTPHAAMDTLSSGETLVDVFTYTASDGVLISTSTLSISVNGSNTAPIADNDNVSIDEDSSVNGLNLLDNDSDLDGDALVITSINGSSNPASNISGVYGVLDWNTDGSYTYAPNTSLNALAVGEQLIETFTYVISDGNGGTNTATLTITINGTNDNLVANDDTNQTITVNSITHLDGSGNILSNDIDVDGDDLQIASVNGSTVKTTVGQYGTLIWLANGSYSYVPNAGLDSLTENESVIEIFNIVVADPYGSTDNAILTITIIGIDVNVAPNAVADRIEINEDDTNVLINVLANDSDADGDVLSVSVLRNPISGGSVSIINNEIIYNPPTDFTGNDYLIYEVCDNGSPVLCDRDTVYIVVNPLNDAPVAVTDYSIGAKGASMEIAVLANDIDVDGDFLTATLISEPTSGASVFINDNVVNYTPPASFVGKDTILYRVCDDAIPSLCDVDTIFIDIIDQVLATDDLITIYSGTSETVSILNNDVFEAAVTIRIINEPTIGTYVLSEDGQLTYISNSNYYGQDTITYVIENEMDSDTAYVIVTVNPLITLTTNTFCQEEIPYYSWEIQSQGIDLSTVDLAIYDINLQMVEFLEGAELVGEREWPGYEAFENNGAYFGIPSFMETIEVTANIEANGYNEQITSVIIAPDCYINKVEANWDSLTVYGSETLINVLENDRDYDYGDIDIASLQIVTNNEFEGPYHGRLVINADGTISYTPEQGYMGLDSFMYRICDDYAEIACDTAVVRLNVLFNGELVAVDDSYSIYINQPIDMFVANNDYDPENELDLTSIIIITDPINGEATVNTDGTISYIPSSDFEGTDLIEYVICDLGSPQECDTARVNISVVENQCVVAERNDTMTFVHEIVNIDVLNNDFDSEGWLDSTSISIVKIDEFDGPYHGKIEISEDYQLIYTPDSLFAGLDSFIYRVCDSSFMSCCDTAVVYVTVVDNNEGILANFDEVMVLGNSNAVVDVINNDIDSDGTIDTTSINIITIPVNGLAVTNTETGEITYTPSNGFIGLDSLIYSICDDGPIVSCDTAVVYFDVRENLPPVAINDTVEAVYGINQTYDIAINDYDPEGYLDRTSINIITQPKAGAVSIDPETGDVRYMPGICESNIDSFTYVIYDMSGNVSNIATVLINISIDPEMDSDFDGVADIIEDLNGDGNPCNDDTDLDGIPNYLDTDDDGDSVPTAMEDPNFDGDATNDDTDNDGIPNYLDINDDGDCEDTIAEDINGDGDPLNDDIDGDGMPNFLENDDDGDGILSCDEMEDRDENGILDNKEIWNSRSSRDIVTIGIEEPINIAVLANDSTTMNDSTLTIVSNPLFGQIEINENDWTIRYIPDLDFVGIDSFTYVVCDYYNNVCDTAVVIINVIEYVIPPNIFTPNDDGDNDLYVIEGLDRYSTNRFKVFNRWGNLVYESENYSHDWGGYSNVDFVIGKKKQLPVGQYYYVLEYGTVSKPKVGSIFIER